jgi:hypothetical protein
LGNRCATLEQETLSLSGSAGGHYLCGAHDELAWRGADEIRDLDPFDLLRALIGVSNVASGPDWQQSARRLVDILITGSRPVK